MLVMAGQVSVPGPYAGLLNASLVPGCARPSHTSVLPCPAAIAVLHAEQAHDRLASTCSSAAKHTDGTRGCTRMHASKAQSHAGGSLARAHKVALVVALRRDIAIAQSRTQHTEKRAVNGHDADSHLSPRFSDASEHGGAHFQDHHRRVCGDRLDLEPIHVPG